MSRFKKRRFNRAVEDLNSFDSADKVAHYLRLSGVTGNRKDGSSCPVSNYIASQCGSEIRSSEYNIAVISITEGSSVYWANAKLVASARPSQALSEFIGRFDRGMYPSLEALDVQ